MISKIKLIAIDMRKSLWCTDANQVYPENLSLRALDLAMLCILMNPWNVECCHILRQFLLPQLFCPFVIGDSFTTDLWGNMVGFRFDLPITLNLVRAGYPHTWLENMHVLAATLSFDVECCTAPYHLSHLILLHEGVQYRRFTPFFKQTL